MAAASFYFWGGKGELVASRCDHACRVMTEGGKVSLDIISVCIFSRRRWTCFPRPLLVSNRHTCHITARVMRLCFENEIIFCFGLSRKRHLKSLSKTRLAGKLNPNWCNDLVVSQLISTEWEATRRDLCSLFNLARRLEATEKNESGLRCTPTSTSKCFSFPFSFICTQARVSKQ